MPDKPERAARSRGRRAGGEGARDDVLAAARAEFTERGYDAASVRGVARRADVDPALVRYYFPGGKSELFAVALAARDIDPARVVDGLLAAGLDDLGTRLVETIVTVWDAPGGRDRFRALLAAAASGEQALLRSFLLREVFGRLAAGLVAAGRSPDDAALRAGLAMAQVAGVLVARHVIEVEDVVRATPAELAQRLGPALQVILTS